MLWMTIGLIFSFLFFSTKFSISASGIATGFHLCGALTKICMHSHPISFALITASENGAAVETCAPNFIKVLPTNLRITSRKYEITNNIILSSTNRYNLICHSREGGNLLNNFLIQIIPLWVTFLD